MSTEFRNPTSPRPRASCNSCGSRSMILSHEIVLANVPQKLVVARRFMFPSTEEVDFDDVSSWTMRTSETSLSCEQDNLKSGSFHISPTTSPRPRASCETNRTTSSETVAKFAYYSGSGCKTVARSFRKNSTKKETMMFGYESSATFELPNAEEERTTSAKFRDITETYCPRLYRQQWS